MTIDAWLEELGLSRYAATFAANAIDFDVLPDLTEADLEKLGLLLGHRKKLLRAIKDRDTAAPGVPSQAPAPSAAQASADAERRQITVLFSDLVGSTDLSQQVDPELLRDFLEAYQAMATAAVKHAGGMLAKFLGDGVLAYFGYPAANDDDAIRAVRAGRAMVAGMADLNARWRSKLGRDLALRVGLHTGLVVVGDMGSGDARESNAIVGETPNLAARVQGLAAPGTVAISGPTWRLVRRVFACRALGVQQAKGVADGIEIHIVEAEAAGDDALEAAGKDIPLVGRAEEAVLLLDRLRRARAGEGQAVLVGGEAGLGKSRLVRAFREASGLDAEDVLVLRCAPQFRNSAFYPLITWLERRLRFGAGDAAATRRDKLDTGLATLGIARPEIAGPLSELLGIATQPEEISEDQRRRRLLGAMRQYLIAETSARPRVLIVEDAHWIDASTQEFIGQLLTPLAELPLFLLITFRPEFVPPWPVASHVASLALKRMTRDEVAQIARRRAGKELPDAVLNELLGKTDGIPLFAEELTQNVIASGAVVERDGRYELAADAGALTIPSSLRDSLTARLDRLSGARQIAQIAAVIGREFPYELLAAVAERDPAALDDDLDALTRNDILRQRGVPPNATYNFKHALLQDAAYDGLLRSVRQQYHARLAAAYERLFPAEVESIPEMVAQHCAQAGLDERAVEYYVRAAEQARRRSGLREAVAHFRAALDRLARLPQSPDRDRREIDALLELGPLIATTEGMRLAFTDSYRRAHELATTLRDDRRRFAANWGLWFCDIAAMDTGASGRRHERIDEMFAIARDLGDPDLELEVHHSRWATRFSDGDLRGTLADATIVLARYDRARHASHRFTYGGHDTGVCAHGFGGMCSAIAGDPARSAVLLEGGLEIARAISDPIALAHGLWMSAMGAQLRGDFATCQALGDEALNEANTHSIVMFNGMTIAIGAWAHHMTGDSGRVRDLTEIGQKMMAIGTNPKMFANYDHILLADIEAETQPATALARLRADQAAGYVGIAFEAELVRRLGVLTLRTDPRARDEAAAHFRKAIDLAQRQGAHAFELRAAFALSRLLAEDRKGEEAHALLAPVVGAFAADIALPDLSEARAFLAALR